jgi:hypothetical protein
MERFIEGYVCLTQEEMADKNITVDDLTPGEWVVGVEDYYWLNPSCETVIRLTEQGVNFV